MMEKSYYFRSIFYFTPLSYMENADIHAAWHTFQPPRPPLCSLLSPLRSLLSVYRRKNTLFSNAIATLVIDSPAMMPDETGTT